MRIFNFLILVVGISFLTACSEPLEATKSDVRTSPPEATSDAQKAEFEVFHWENLSFSLKNGERISFKVQVADSDYERSLGYMFRRSIPDDTGIFFKFPVDVRHGFWMKNVILPLDVIFINRTGEIIYIEENAPPGSIDPFGPKVPYAGVVEIAGGQTSLLNIAVGDKISHPFFKNN